MWVWMVVIIKSSNGQLSQRVLMAVGGMVPTWACWVSDPLTGNGLQNGHLYNLIWITTRVMNMGFARNKTKQVIQLRWPPKPIAFPHHLEQMCNYKSLVGIAKWSLFHTQAWVLWPWPTKQVSYAFDNLPYLQKTRLEWNCVPQNKVCQLR